MTAIQVTIRNAAYDKVKADLPTYGLSDCDLEKTFFPRSKVNLEELGDKPIIRFVAVGIASSRNRVLRNPDVVQLEVPVQLAIQQRVDPSDTDYLDRLVELNEQVAASLEDDELVTGENYTWETTEPLRDDNGLIYSYEDLVANNVFQAIFTVTYSYIKQS